MTTRCAVILNLGSGTHSMGRAEVENALLALGGNVKIVEPKRPSDICSNVSSLIQAGYEIIVAGGGDGTVSAVASTVAGTDAALGILPLGTLNHFARDLGIPPTLPDAVRTLVEGQVVNLDVGEVNGRVFINNISLGLYPAFVEARGNVRRRSPIMRWLVILAATLRVLSQLPLMRTRLTIDGKSLKRTTPLVFIGNNEYQLEGVNAGSRQRLADGCLSLVTTQRKGPWGLMRLVVRASLGTLRGAKDLDVIRGTMIEVQTKGWSTPLAVDGEVADEISMPLRCSVRQGALKVLVPKQSPAAES